MKKTVSLSKNNYLPLFLFLLTVISGLFIIFSFSIGLNGYDAYDYAEGVFWAEATLKSHSLVNPDYVYYYLVPLGSNVIMAPFVYLFGTSYIANQLGMIVFFVLYIALVYRLASLLYQKTHHRLLFCTITSLFIFTYAGDNLLHHLLSYGIGLLCFLGELCCLIEIRDSKKTLPFVLLVVLAFWASANGIASVALSGVPVFLAMLVLSYQKGTLFKKNTIITFCLFVFATLAGLAFYKYCDSIATTLNMYNDRFMLAEPDDLATHFTHDLIVDYLRVFLYNPKDTYLFSFTGLFGLAKLGFAFISIAAPVALWIKRRKSPTIETNGNENVSLVLWSCLLLMLVCVGQYVIFFKNSHRYLINLLIALFMITAIFYIDFEEKNNDLLGKIILVLLVLLFGFKSVSGVSPHGKGSKANLDNINNILQENGLTYGYATYRHFKCLELISNGRIRNSVISYNEEAGRFYVDFDRIYREELQKPDGIDRFYILKFGEFEEEFPGDVFLEKTCTNRIESGEDTICIYPIEDWDKILTEKQPWQTKN